MGQVFASRERETARLAQYVRFENLFGRYQPSNDMSPDSTREIQYAAVANLDLENDRMFVIVSPHDTPASMVAVRAVIDVSQR